MSTVTKVTVQEIAAVTVSDEVPCIQVPASEGVVISVPAIQGPAGPSCIIEDSKTLTYEDGLLSEVQTAKGTKTFVYDTNQVLVGIVGAGQYPNKTFTYDTNGLLIAVDVE